ncbi:MAG: citryl-CoA lyase [Paraburkholderia sp.]|jgi:citrate synthase|uniref:citryl-CoA lyase n=1 Tax=Burkholderiaceae TaxID=119060 RepID=UPI0010F71187|nr:citryl-CoA lyase [Burkholderia sp. 4M9327F10]
MTHTPLDPAALAADYWSTSIIDIHPGSIQVRGYPIQELIGQISFPQMIWLMLRGDLPSAGEARLLEAALVASVDHGPHAPSIAISRMAVSCGLPMNGAMASALNTLDDVHGGAGQQAVEIFHAIEQAQAGGAALAQAVESCIDAFIAAHGKYLPGFGHRFHPVDPRAGRLLGMVDEAAAEGVVSGRYAAIARGIEALLKARKSKPIPMNIDGATAVIYAELGFAPELARGVFCLSRAVGILSHAWEQRGRGERNKGPMPRQMAYRYTGPATRHLDPEEERQ